MSDYLKDWRFLKAEVHNCRIENPELAYKMACRLEAWSGHVVESGMLPDSAVYAPAALDPAPLEAVEVRPEFVSCARITPRMNAAVRSARRKSQVAFDAARVDSEGRVAPGLVSVSTTLTGSVSVVIPWGEATKADWAAATIEIDPQKSRVTRLRKGLGVGAKRLHNMGSRRDNKCLVTLTYRGDNRDWQPDHIGKYINAVRAWYRRLTGQGLRYAWVAELQKRGVIHYHVVFWLTRSVNMPKADRRGWWPHGMSNTIRATAPVAYLMKYVSKVDSKNVGSFPHGARIFGLGGLDKTGRDCKRWVLWPAYLQSNAAAGDPFKPAVGGGYTNSETGQHFCAEYAPTGGGFTHFVRVHKHERAIDAGGPFSWFPNAATVH